MTPPTGPLGWDLRSGERSASFLATLGTPLGPSHTPRQIGFVAELGPRFGAGVSRSGHDQHSPVGL